MSTGKKTKPTSPKQHAANQRNAEKSTGPRSEAGKARSSKNAMTHGIYAHPTPIPAGEFAEDPTEIAAFTRDVVDGLDPRNGFERMLATRVATALLHAARLDRYSALQIAKSSKVGVLALMNSSTLLPDPVEAEVAAEQVISRSLERISQLDARVGRELERSLAIYKRAREILGEEEP